MLAQELIRIKRDGRELDADAIETIVRGITDASFSDAQVAAFAMCVFHQGMTPAETAAFTSAMASSGERLQWYDACELGPCIDKHSTGGVGDKVSLVLAPMLAACGARVPMVSGRGLGHTGGTLDKLESIPGYRVQVEDTELHRVVERAGCAIVGASERLAPADRRLYAIRDVTASVDSLPLITASILSKKLAAGVGSLVMDVKTGTGAFASTRDSADALASSLVEVATQAGLPTVALITDMNQVLGRCAGNALEVGESIDFLTGNYRDPRLTELVLALGGVALQSGGLSGSEQQAQARLQAVLDDGSAAECFQRMIFELGGPADLIENSSSHLSYAPVVKPLRAKAGGTVVSMNVLEIGLALVELGAGRRDRDDEVDHGVGISDVCAIGQSVDVSDSLATVHARSDAAAERALNRIGAAVEIAHCEAGRTSVVLGRVD